MKGLPPVKRGMLDGSDDKTEKPTTADWPNFTMP